MLFSGLHRYLPAMNKNCSKSCTNPDLFWQKDAEMIPFTAFLQSPFVWIWFSSMALAHESPSVLPQACCCVQLARQGCQVASSQLSVLVNYYFIQYSLIMGFSRYLGVLTMNTVLNSPLLCLQMIKQLQQRMAELKKTLQKELVRVVCFQSLQMALAGRYLHCHSKSLTANPPYISLQWFISPRKKKIYIKKKISRGFKIVIFALMLKIILKKAHVWKAHSRLVIGENYQGIVSTMEPVLCWFG